MNADCLRLQTYHVLLARQHPSPFGDSQCLLGRFFRVMQQCVRKLPRPQRSVLLIPAVGEGFCCRPKSRSAKFVQHLRTRQSHEHHVLPPPPHALGNRPGNSCIRRRLVVERPVRLHVPNLCPALFGNRRQLCNLPVHRVANLFRRQRKRSAPKILAVLVARMGPNGDAVPQRLLDRLAHQLFITRVSAARHIRRCYSPHQRFLPAVGQQLRQFAHVAIQIQTPHANNRSSEVSSRCCSIHNALACSSDTSANRITSRGRNCPTQCISAPITFAIFGYPPVACCSTNKTIACPDGVTCTAPSGAPSLIISFFSRISSRGPCSRKPIRFDSSLTTNSARNSDAQASSANHPACGPGVTRNSLLGLSFSSTPTAIFRCRISCVTSPTGNTSPFCNARPFHPPTPLKRCVDALPRNSSTTIPPATHK